MFPRRLWVLLCPLALLTNSCSRKVTADNDPVWRRLELKRMELVQQRELAEFKVAQMEIRRTKGADQIATAARLTVYRAELEAYRDTLRADVPLLETALAAAHADRLAETRRKAKGLEFATLTTRTGTTFEKVKVEEVRDDGAKISHSSGFARLRVEDLDQQMCDRLGLDESLEQLAVRQIEARQSAYHREADQTLAANQFMTSPPVTPARPPHTYIPVQPGSSSGYSNFGFSRRIGFGESENPETPRTYRIWRNGRSTPRYYSTYRW
ncbi:hypothetical protein KBB96_19525 [Luteolibacter ambystomatis]|uniref:Uncharacterized protein n=1 Tax=Luteolibacter ambystomatis TaxID=2824561 RepID=A0A975G8Q4_9BACT|nr:hypothetical protein [Luteolibacter ambystomatis]QUE51033.1 hypothetical protein KBB96_19525 [Luteolibacter ambystomatis]